jgi:dipeptidase E
MKKLFLTSSANFVISDIVSKIGFDTHGKKLVFIKTAAEDLGEINPEWLEEDRQGLEKFGFEVTDYTISNKTEEQLRKDLAQYDVIFVSGGNTYYLLQESQKTNFIPIIQDLVKEGKVYIGSSAGSVITGPDIASTLDLDDVGNAPDLKDMNGFNLVDFVVLPHWGSSLWKNVYMKMDYSALYEMNIKLIFLRDTQYVEVSGDEYKIVDTI